MSAPSGRRYWRKERSFRVRVRPAGWGKGTGYGAAGAAPRWDDVRRGGGAGAARLRPRARGGAGPGGAHVGGLFVPALRQQGGLRPGGAGLQRGRLLPLGGMDSLRGAACGRGDRLPRGVLHLLVQPGELGVRAAGPLLLHLPAPLPGDVRAAAARQCGPGPGARSPPSGGAGRCAGAGLRPSGRGARLGDADRSGAWVGRAT